jgi:hypothetical protein
VSLRSKPEKNRLANDRNADRTHLTADYAPLAFKATVNKRTEPASPKMRSPHDGHLPPVRTAGYDENGIGLPLKTLMAFARVAPAFQTRAIDQHFIPTVDSMVRKLWQILVVEQRLPGVVSSRLVRLQKGYSKVVLTIYNGFYRARHAFGIPVPPRHRYCI